MSSRMFQLLREVHGLAYDVEADVDAYADTASMIISAVVERENLDKTLDLILDELERLKKDSITKEEFERTKRMLSAQLNIERDSLSTLLWHAVESEINHGKQVRYEEVLQSYEELTLEKMSEFINNWIVDAKHLLVLGGDVEDYEVSDRIKGECL